MAFEIEGWHSIKGYHVGIVHGAGLSEAGTRALPNVQWATSLEDPVRMLDRGRFDVLVTDLFSGQVETKRQPLDSRIRPLLPPLERIHLYHCHHERHHALVPKVETVVREMATRGEFVAQVIEQSGAPRG